MPLESAADLAEFLDTDEFAVAGGVGASIVNGIHDAQYLEALGFEGSAPMFLVRAIDVTNESIVQGTQIIISSVTYKIQEIQPDGSGMTLLILEDQT